MHNVPRRILQAGVLLATVAAASLGSATALAAAPPAALPAATCALVGTTRTCDLYAKTGTLGLPGSVNVPIWGYASSASGAAQMPGPAIIANQGETVAVILHNGLTGPSSLDFPGLANVPDQTGAAPGATRTYTFSASQPGTSLYQAGLTVGGTHQVAMGMFGPLVVRPSGCVNCVYDAGSSFDDEALVIVSEIDPNLNTGANPATFDLRNFTPTYRLINGQAYPQTNPIVSVPGHRLALRYLNAGLQDHSMGLLGLHQTVLATDGHPLTHSYKVVSETVPAGASMDTMVTLPSGASGGQYALLDQHTHLDNAGARLTDGTVAFGGAMTFITTVAATGDTQGPVTSNVLLQPAATNGASPVALSASVSDATTGNSNVAAAEYFIDTVAAASTGTAMTGTFTSPTVAVSASIPASTLGTLASGPHTVFVHGKDAPGNWGATTSVTLTINNSTTATGPSMGTVTVTPNPTFGATNVTIGGTATGSANVGPPGSNIAAAEWFDGVDPGVGHGTAMQASNGAFNSARTVQVIATINVSTWTAGAHVLSVRARDAAGNWGAPSTATLSDAQGGPATTGLSLTPALTNGSANVTLQGTGDATAVGNNNVDQAEYFIGTVGATGTGTAMTLPPPAPVQPLVATIPAATVAALAEGNHIVSVHSHDATGAWGPFATITLVVDKTGPGSHSVTIAPNPNNGTQAFDPNGSQGGSTAIRVSATVTDPAVNGVSSAIAAAELYLDTVGANGSGSVMLAHDGSFDQPTEDVYQDVPLSAIRSLSEGPHTFYVHGQDAAGNWGPTATGTLVVDRTAPNVTGVTVSPNPTNGATPVTLNATATDPVVPGTAAGSNIAAAEWFDGADPGVGSGTAMQASNGNFNATPALQVTTTINASTWTAGSHVLSVRARDAAGNWGTVSTTTLQVFPDLLFADSFESGNFSGWSTATGVAATAGGTGISVTPAAQMGSSGSLGMQATVAGNTPGFVTENLATAQSALHARFYFNANGSNTGITNGEDILAARNTGGTTAFRVQARHVGTADQVRLQVIRSNGAAANTNWFNLPSGAHAIEVAWAAGTNSTAALFIDGTQMQSMTGLNTNTFTISSLRLGPSAGTNTGTHSGTRYFDAVVVTRTTPIGP